MERIDVGGQRLRVDMAGSGPPNLVCLHGLVDRLEIWDKISAPLAERGRVIRADQRGHGDSDAPSGPYLRADLAADVAALIDRCAGGRAVLVGHSMGGIVSMATALDYPERVAGLVLIGTASQCNEKVAGWYERIALAGEKHGTGGLAKAIYGEKTPKIVTGDAQGIAHVTRMLKSLHEDPLTPKLAGIRCPVLLLVGETDPMGPKASSIIGNQLSDARLEVIPECGHWIHVERPDAVLSALDRWLPRVAGAGDGS